MVFVPDSELISTLDEKKKYDMHENSPEDEGYRRFLSRLLEPMSERLTENSHGLDFGSGPGPTLSLMFEELGHEMSIYDVFYAPDESVFEKQYDFITSTEVVEHLRRPKIELERLWNSLKPGGWLGLMTQPVLGKERFPKWRYKDDPTHIRFYSELTFQWIALQFRTECVHTRSDVWLFYKSVES